MTVVIGNVERFSYRNESNGYTVIRFQPEGARDLETAVGIMPDIHLGERLKMTGEWVTHAEYGQQFSVQAYEQLAPATLQGIEKYLGSGLIKGIGPMTAKNIVKAFGLDSLEVIQKEPSRLLEVEGIGSKKAEVIAKAVTDQQAIQEVMVYLQGAGVTPGLAAKIYRHYGDQALMVVRKNPFRLADEVFGIGFKTADRLAQQLGMDPEAPQRVRAGIRYFLGRESDEGHIYALRSDFCGKVAEELMAAEEKVGVAIDLLIQSGDLVAENGTDGERLYLSSFYNGEFGVAQRLVALLRNYIKLELPERVMNKVVGSTLAPEQKEAISAAFRHGVLVVTGGPGTGKTTTVKGIIQAFHQLNCSVLLAAPTGRAAKRLAEATGEEAKTIHRLLEYGYSPEKGSGFSRNEDQPLSADVVIVDEVSMVDLMLFHNLLRALPLGTRLIMVGDSDQLPSVGAGNVLRDLIKSGVVPVVRLQTIFRQARGSRIVTNAHRINQGLLPEIRDAEDFYYIKAEEPEELTQQILQLVSTRLPKYLHCDAIEDIQVISPMRRTITGVEHLNQVLQEGLNPFRESRPEVRIGGTTFRLGDKVMQIRNNYTKMVFNGDVGRIVRLDPEDRQIEVVYQEPGNNRVITYESEDLDELVLSYAVSVHKSQGSEYPVVVMPITTQHFMMLQRNLLYTAVTRAKKMVVLVGTWKALSMAVGNNRIEERRTTLAQRLSELLREVEHHQGTLKMDV